MRRIRDNRENETLENAQEAFERYADQKHKRWNIMRYEADIDENTHRVLQEIIEESFVPSGYKEKWIYDKKPRKLAKAPVFDHHCEAAHMLPYETQVYDHISWRAPAVRPNLGTHAMMRFIRNELYRFPQDEVFYHVMLDVHHYFPLMDHELLKKKISNKFKAGKLRNFIFRVIDSYPQGAPLGIKLAQLFGMLYLADFDRLMERFFDIPKDPEKMAYWTSRYITEWILTAKSPDERLVLEKGSAYLAETIRGGLNSLGRSEIEAAMSIGMTGGQVLRRIIIPQVLVISIPNFSSHLIGIIQATSLAFYVTLVEITGTARIMAMDNWNYYEAYLATGLIYWLLTISVEIITFIIEKIVAKRGYSLKTR